MMMSDDDERQMAAIVEQLERRCAPSRTVVLFTFDRSSNEAQVISKVGVDEVAWLVLRWAIARVGEYARSAERRISGRLPPEA